MGAPSGDVVTTLPFAVVKIHLDSNGQFKWCTVVSSSTVKIGSAIDYDM
jgi:hypothetical protein